MPDDYSPISSSSTGDFKAFGEKKSRLSHLPLQRLKGPYSWESFEVRYRSEMASRFAVIEHMGFFSGQDEPPMSLGEMYVPQRLLLTATNDFSADRSSGSIGISDALELFGHVVVLGGPGSGKSTLVQFLTYSFSWPGMTPIARKFGARLPIPIILRKYDVKEWETAGDMLKSFISVELSNSLGQDVSVEALSNCLEQGAAILLVDGFDEVGDEQVRRELLTRLTRWLVRWPRVPVVITGRPDLFQNLDFSVAAQTISAKSHLDSVPPLITRPQYLEIAPFSKREISEFIEKWYLLRIPSQPQRDNAVSSLLTAINSSEGLGKMAQIPSLLILMALIHRNLAYLPSGRVELYDRITDAYLETLHRSRGMRPFGAPVEQMKRWLANLAFAMMDKGKLVANKRDILSWLEPVFRDETPNVVQLAEEFLEFVERRAGLMIAIDPGTYTWAHFSLQEYFAARYLKGEIRHFENLIDLSVQLAKNDLWHETLVLLFGMLSEFSGAADDLAQGMMDRADRFEHDRDSVHAFFILLLGNEPDSNDSNESNGGYSFFASYDLTHGKKQRLVEWLLESCCRNLGPKACNRIFLLKGFGGGAVKAWFSREMEVSEPRNLGENFFAIAHSLLAPGFWSLSIHKYLQKYSEYEWTRKQIRDVNLACQDDDAVVAWSTHKLSLAGWFQEDFFNVCPADIQLPALLKRARTSPKSAFLSELAAVMAVNRSMLTRHLLWLAIDNSAEARLSLDLIHEVTWPSSNTEVESSLVRTIDVWRFNDSIQAPDAPIVWYSNKSSPSDELLVRELSPNEFDHLISITTRSCVASIIRSGAYKDSSARWRTLLASVFAHDLWSHPDIGVESFARRVSEVAYDFSIIHVARPQQMEEQSVDAEELIKKIHSLSDGRSDDWTTVAIQSCLLLTGLGTPEIVRNRNILLDKLVLSQDSFTFPDEFLSSVPQVQRDPEWKLLMRSIFLHSPGQPCLLPEWFQDGHRASAYFCSDKHDLVRRLFLSEENQGNG